MKNGKSNFGFLYTYIKYGKFWSISPGHFIKHKPLIYEECSENQPSRIIFIISNKVKNKEAE